MVRKVNSKGMPSVELLGYWPVKKGTRKKTEPQVSKERLDFLRERAINRLDIFTGMPAPPDPPRKKAKRKRRKT